MKDEHPDTLFRDVAVVLGIAFFIYISTNIAPITPQSISSGETPAILLSYVIEKVPIPVIQSFFLSLQNTLAILGLLFVAGAFWATLKIREVHHKEHEKYKPVQMEEIVASEKTIQWKVVLNHLESENSGEWKLAILEADNILSEVLEDLGYEGDTVAEKLKNMSPTRIASYDALWEAHKLRNKIAHGETLGEDMSNKLAHDTIMKFENAFKELGYL